MDCLDAKRVKRNLAPKIKMETRVNCKLRTVAVPDDIISNSKFLKVAKVNSDRNVETLGTLCGQLCNNKFRVTHLMIPRQMASLTVALWMALKTLQRFTRRRTLSSSAGFTPILGTGTVSSSPAWTCTTSTRGSVCFPRLVILQLKANHYHYNLFSKVI